MSMTPIAEQNKLKIVQRIFNQLFEVELRTRLDYGFSEPFYRAPSDALIGQIQTRYDYLSSALHEIAHWCIAGASRRAQDDYGYWYEPDGRSGQQQALFEQVEVKPQALEWILSACCKHEFNFSADNLNGDVQLSTSFTYNVRRQVESYWANGLADRSQKLVDALCEYFYRKDSPSRPTLEQIFRFLKTNQPSNNAVISGEAVAIV